MMRARLLRLWEFRSVVLAGVDRFPVALLALGAFVIYVNLGIAEILHLEEDELARAGAASGAAAALATALVLFGERQGIGPVARQLLAFLAAACVGAAILAWERLAVAPVTLLAATVLAVPVAPYLRQREGFWAFLWRLVHAGALAFVAVIVFCLGVSAILASLDYLFGIDISDRIYGHIWSIGLGFVGPLFALSLVPRAVPATDAPNLADIIVSGVRILADFVAVPLLAAYALILHAYALKILVTGEVPRNQIGWMVLSFGLAVLALRVLVHPLHDLGRAPTRLFLRFWALALPVPLGLLAFAAFERIEAHGLTPQRYGLLLFAAFLTIVLAAQLARRWRGDIRVIAVAGALCLFAASFGPWGAIPATARSQTERVLAQLARAGVLEEGRLARPPEWDREPAAEMQSRIGILDSIGQLDRLRPLFAGRPDDPFTAPPAAPSGETPSLRRRLEVALSADPILAPVTSGSFYLETAGPTEVAVDGFDLLVPGLFWRMSAPAAIADPALTVDPRPDGIHFRQGEREFVLPAEALRDAVAGRLEAMRAAKGAVLPPLFLDLTLEGRRIGLLIENLAGELTEENIQLQSGRIDLFLRRADWRG